MKITDINKIYGKLKMKCFEMPNASYTNRWQQLTTDKISNLKNKKNMIGRVKVDGNYLETIDSKGKRIKRTYKKCVLLGNSSEIVIVQDGNYLEILDEDLKIISRIYKKIDGFLGASGNTFSIQDGNYAETLDEKGKRVSRQYSKQ